MAYDSNTSGYGDTYLSINGLDINVDGEISSHIAEGGTQLDSSPYNTISRTIHTSSRNSVIIPYDLMKRMVDAEDCRLRIHTGKGYEDAQFSIERIPGGKATAIASFRDFLERTEAIKNR